MRRLSDIIGIGEYADTLFWPEWVFFIWKTLKLLHLSLS